MLGGVGGLALSVLLIAVFVVAEYLTIIRQLRQAATMAQRLASGDLGARLPDQGVGEIGVLERSFNAMASALQESRDELLHPESGLSPLRTTPGTRSSAT